MVTLSYFRRSASKRLAPALLLLAASMPALAIMAGGAPDSPVARVDANTSASPWSATGCVVVGGSHFSGVAIASRYVLTASHVAGGQMPANVHFVLNHGTGASYAALAITTFPSASFPYDDLTIIELANPLPADVPIYPVYAGTLSAGLRITLVGYGASGNGNVGPSVGSSSAIKRRGENTIDAVQTTLDSSGRSSRFYVYDFDGPTGSGALGGPSLGNTVETLVASGDSGGPAFASIGGSTWLVGINTFVAPAAPGAPTDYKFGMLGGGILLNDPRFLQWIAATVESPAHGYDVPALPPWAMLALAVLLVIVTGHARRNTA